MLKIVSTNTFEKDVKKVVKRGYDIKLLKEAIEYIVENEVSLPIEKYKTHQLKGEWKGAIDSHLKPDWLLIYKIERDCLILIRTGTHVDLFE